MTGAILLAIYLTGLFIALVTIGIVRGMGDVEDDEAIPAAALACMWPALLGFLMIFGPPYLIVLGVSAIVRALS